jgi:hypothetical protein
MILANYHGRDATSRNGSDRRSVPLCPAVSRCVPLCPAVIVSVAVGAQVGDGSIFLGVAKLCRVIFTSGSELARSCRTQSQSS